MYSVLELTECNIITFKQPRACHQSLESLQTVKDIGDTEIRRCEGPGSSSWHMYAYLCPGTTCDGANEFTSATKSFCFVIIARKMGASCHKGYISPSDPADEEETISHHHCRLTAAIHTAQCILVSVI
ncbi:hypothetical protein R3I93_015536 [Phoxinus phoxinus]|uniref:Uncharacterized protein n=1 Tax=Phoxinus phoxinus TaxID=58324 RepID=A0AAN9CLE5_9TELE